MTCPRCLIPPLAMVLTAPVHAQAVQAATQEPVEPVTVSEWSAARSRALFASLDEDANDRIDLLEAAGLRTLAGVTDLDSFRRLDRNRDGHLDREEFDAHFRDLMAHGQVLRLRPARLEPLAEKVAPREAAPAPADPAASLLARLDKSGDGDLDRSELGRFLEQNGLPASLLAHFDKLDRDRSGTVSTAEFRPFLGLLPAALLAVSAAPSTSAGLPHGFDGQDLDRNGRIDSAELGGFLWRLDPSLQRWAGEILGRADLDGDGTLDAAEITRSMGQGPAASPAPKRSEL